MPDWEALPLSEKQIDQFQEKIVQPAISFLLGRQFPGEVRPGSCFELCEYADQDHFYELKVNYLPLEGKVRYLDEDSCWLFTALNVYARADEMLDGAITLYTTPIIAHRRQYCLADPEFEAGDFSAWRHTLYSFDLSEENGLCVRDAYELLQGDDLVWRSDAGDEEAVEDFNSSVSVETLEQWDESLKKTLTAWDCAQIKTAFLALGVPPRLLDTP